jgi:hypothetical protein
MTNQRRVAFTATFSLLATAAMLATLVGQQAPASAKTWLDRVALIEDYIRSAEVTGIEELKVGVTKPGRARLAPGGPVESIAWKPIKPARYAGYWESYKSEIAAYELDKLLALGMVPPTVEKRVKGDLGAAVMWASPTKSFKDLGGVPGQGRIPGPPPPLVAAWNQQLTKAKMFDNLIANIDPNLGNWLVDPAWNLILIDHTRSFTTTRDLYHKLLQVDQELWARMKALDEAALTPALGKWLDRSAITAILQRRDRMQQVIDKLKPTS